MIRTDMAATVIAYHAVGDVAPEDDPYSLWVPTASFEQQLAYLARHRRVVPLSDIVSGTAPRQAVAITFDDAYRSVLTTAAPLLQRHGFPATVFTPTAYIGDRNRWDPPAGRVLEIMDADGLREAEAAGIAVESHGHGHVDLSQADADIARADLSASIERLEQIVRRRPEFVAFPFRTGSAAARAAARELGFKAAFTIDLRHDGQYGWGRVGVAPGDGMTVFSLKTSGQYLRLRHNAVLSGGYRILRRVVPRR